MVLVELVRHLACLVLLVLMHLLLVVELLKPLLHQDHLLLNFLLHLRLEKSSRNAFFFLLTFEFLEHGLLYLQCLT
mgnify:CR=1 FL=1